MIQVIGRHRRFAKNRQDQHNQKMDHKCGDDRRYNPLPAPDPGGAEPCPKDPQQDRRQQHQNQREQIGQNGVEHDLPEFKHLSAVAHGIGGIEAFEYLIIDELRRKDQKNQEHENPLQNAVDLCRENTTHHKQNQRRYKCKQKSDKQSAAPELTDGGRPQDDLVKADIKPQDRQ